MLDDIIRFIQNGQTFAITSHARPDGDSLGSSLGLALALEQLGKHVTVVHADPAPRPYKDLPGLEKLVVSPTLRGDFDGLLVLECNSLERTGVKGLEQYRTVNIDHHSDSGDYGVLNWVDWSAAALGEMIHELVLRLGATITPEIASNLYVAILTDTGSFQFSNTTQRTFAITAQLVASGANPGEIAQSVYLSQPLSKLRLLTAVLETLEVHPSGKIAWIELTRRALLETGAAANDTEGIVTHALSIDGVMMVAFLRQMKDDLVRVSLRSKPGYDVAKVARRYGGGGHANAAGLSLSGDLESARARIVADLEQELE